MHVHFAFLLSVDFLSKIFQESNPSVKQFESIFGLDVVSKLLHGLSADDKSHHQQGNS